MPNYDIALILTVNAPNYEAALKYADTVAAGVGMDEENISAVWNYEEDLTGQRVLYLHPEDAANDWEPSDDA